MMVRMTAYEYTAQDAEGSEKKKVPLELEDDGDAGSSRDRDEERTGGRQDDRAREYRDIRAFLNELDEDINFMRNQIKAMKVANERRKKKEWVEFQKRQEVEKKVEHHHQKRGLEFKRNMVFKRAVSKVRSHLRSRGYSEEFLREHEDLVEEKVEEFLFDD